MAISLPTKLENEPLIDAIFEVRFVSNNAASVILPGVFFNKLRGDKKIETLATQQIPKAIRDTDQNLKYAATNRIDWDSFFINISDYSVSISCKYPYPGWRNFRDAIVTAITILQESKIVDKVDRYSLKYVDILPFAENEEKISKLNFDVSIAGHALTNEQFQFRAELPRDGFIHAVQLVSSAKAQLHTGLEKEGLIVDVDTVAALVNITFDAFVQKIENKLDEIHRSNKKIFFDCLKEETIKSLKPSYE